MALNIINNNYWGGETFLVGRAQTSHIVVTNCIGGFKGQGSFFTNILQAAFTHFDLNSGKPLSMNLRLS